MLWVSKTIRGPDLQDAGADAIRELSPGNLRSTCHGRVHDYCLEFLARRWWMRVLGFGGIEDQLSYTAIIRYSRGVDWHIKRDVKHFWMEGVRPFAASQ